MKATIAILTFNGRPWIDQLLSACLSQELDANYEVLVIDSGSRDGTVEAVKRREEVRLHEIPNSEFGHGRTRNLAVCLARGEFVVFLTQDALPANTGWLAEMLHPFEIGDRVACVVGKQVPHADCCPTVKRDVLKHFMRFGPDHFTMIQRDGPHLARPEVRDAVTFLSNVNSAVRRSVVLERVPFRDVPYAEDQALGQDLIAAGYFKAYAPLGAVIHSHSYAPRKYFRRMYEEFSGLRAATGQTLDTDLGDHIRIAIRGTLGDWTFTWRDRSYGKRAKLHWFVRIPFYNAARRVAIRLVTREVLPPWARRLMATG